MPCHVRKLSSEERAAYDRQGYVALPGILPAGELAELNREMDALSERGDGTNAPHQGWVMQLAERTEKTRAFARDPRILSLIEDIVTPGIAIYSAKLTVKNPHSAEECHWHQDDAYYVQNSQSRTRMSIWVPLQDATRENGCLWVVPGSHAQGLQVHARREDGQCRLALREEPDFSKAVPLPVKAGTVVLFSALLWHHSKGNETGGVRRAFIVSYQEATVQGGNGAQWKILRPAV